MISLNDVQAARETISDAVHITPSLSCETLGTRLGVRLRHKAELFQKTGSFKPRGALNCLRRTPRATLEQGLITISAGNHGQGLAYAASIVGARCTVVMPAEAPAAKVDAVRSYGGEVVLHGTIPEAYAKCEELEAEQGSFLVHPYEHPLVIAGQGTVGLEILEQVPDVDVIVVPEGGGGLISGIATAVKALRPEVRIVAVEPAGACALARSLAAGTKTQLERVDTIADGLAAPRVGEIAFDIIRELVDDVVLVDDAEIATGMEAVMRYAKLVVEPAGAAATAALLAGKVGVQPGTVVVSVLTGGNVDLRRLPFASPAS